MKNTFVIVSSLLIGLVGASVHAPSVHAEDAPNTAPGEHLDDRAKLVKLFEEQVELLHEVEFDAKRIDKARLVSFGKLANASKKTVKGADSLIDGDVVDQLRQYWETVEGCSRAFFEKIKSGEHFDAITRFIELHNELGKFGGFNKHGSYHTYNVYFAMYNLLNQLSTMADEDLNKKIASLIGDLGNLHAHAHTYRDVPSTFALGRKMYFRIKNELYPFLNKIAASSAAYNIALEIMGSNENYGDYAETGKSFVMERDETPEAGK